MKAASIRELRHETSTVLGWVEAGEQVEIRRRGRPVAVLSRPRRKPAGSGRPDFLERLKSIYGDRVLEVTATDVLSGEREGR